MQLRNLKPCCQLPCQPSLASQHSIAATERPLPVQELEVPTWSNLAIQETKTHACGAPLVWSARIVFPASTQQQLPALAAAGQRPSDVRARRPDPDGDGDGDGGRRGPGAGGGGRAVLRGGRGDAGRGQSAQHVRERLRRHGRRHGRARAARRRRALQPAPPLRPRRRRPPARPHRPRIGADAEHAVEGVPGRQHQQAGPALHRRQAVSDPAPGLHQGQRVPRQQRRRAGLRLQDHRQLPRRRLRRLARRLRHCHRQDRPAVQRGQRAAGEEHVQRHRQPGHRLRLRRRARRHPRRDALPAMTRACLLRFRSHASSVLLLLNGNVLC